MIGTAVLGIIGTFIASPLAVQIYNQFQLPAISDKRRQTLEGRWKGTMQMSLLVLKPSSHPSRINPAALSRPHPAPQLAGVEQAGRIMGRLGRHLVGIHHTGTAILHAEHVGIGAAGAVIAAEVDQFG